jgi:hypothetical protein
MVLGEQIGNKSFHQLKWNNKLQVNKIILFFKHKRMIYGNKKLVDYYDNPVPMVIDEESII